MSIKLKLLRVQAHMTLEDLAKAADLTRSYVSKIERGVSSPSIGAAISLAKALHVPVEELFGGPSEKDPLTITRAADAAPRPKGAPPRVVAGTAPGLQMLGFVLKPNKSRGSDHPMSHHEGEEILYVLRGSVQLKLADRTELLKTGDCAHFNATVPHKILPIGGDPEVLVVIAGKSAKGRERTS